jgi:hypothetical protein
VACRPRNGTWLTILIGIVAALLDTRGIDWIELIIQIALAAGGVSLAAGILPESLDVGEDLHFSFSRGRCVNQASGAAVRGRTVRVDRDCSRTRGCLPPTTAGVLSASQQVAQNSPKSCRDQCPTMKGCR